MSTDGYTRPQLVTWLANFFVDLDSQGLDCIQLIYDATEQASSVVPTLICFRIMLAMLCNFKSRLASVARHERQSGVYHALLGSVIGTNISSRDLCYVFSIDRRTAKKSIAKEQQHHRQFEHTGKYLPLVQKPIIKRVRIDPGLLERIEDFFLSQSSPSADKTKVKRRKLARHKYEEKAIQYRTTTIEKLLILYQVCYYLLFMPCFPFG